MTLVCAMRVEGMPILIGDLLITSTPSTQEMLLPLSGLVHGAGGAVFDGRQIVGLEQKIALINDHVALGWSGTTAVAKSILREIKQILGNSPADGNRMNQIFSMFSKQDLAHVSMVGALSYKGHVEICGQVRLYSQQYGPYYAAGTGIHHMVELLDSPVDYFTEGSIVGFPVPATTALWMAGHLLGAEVRGKGTLQDHYGGAFEIAYSDGHMIRKFGDILWSFWNVTVVSSEQFSFAPIGRVLKQSYRDKTLLLRSIDLEWKSATNASLSGDDFYVVSPIYRNTRNVDIGYGDRPVLNSAVQVINFIATYQGRIVSAGGFVHVREPDKNVIHFDGHPKPNTVYLDAHTLTKVFQKVAASVVTHEAKQ